VDIDSLVELQNRLVFAAVRELNDGWDVAVFNVEIEEVETELSVNSLAFYMVRKDGAWLQHSIKLANGCSDLFRKLRDSATGKEWSICTLEVASDGRYEFSYSYDLPQRSNGIINNESMLDDYVPTLM
jgi:hypothetical protein